MCVVITKIWFTDLNYTHRLLRGIPYSGKLSREKTLRTGEKYDFHGESFCRLVIFAKSKDFTEKTANSHKTAKFVKVFSLECFPIYSMYIKNSAAPITRSLPQKYERQLKNIVTECSVLPSV